MLCIGHRGARGYAPENTLASVRKAMELGTDWIEIDVHTVDGQLIVFHDERLERTTNGAGLLVDQRFDDLRRLDAGNGEQIPTLVEVFDLAAEQVGINVELKGPGTAEPVVQFLRAWQRSHNAHPPQILLSSFRHDELRRVQQLAPEIPRGALFVDLPADAVAQAQALGAWSINPAKESVTPEFVAAAHAAGLKVLVFTVNEIVQMQQLQAMGVDGLFTDYPDRLVGLRC